MCEKMFARNFRTKILLGEEVKNQETLQGEGTPHDRTTLVGSGRVAENRSASPAVHEKLDPRDNVDDGAD